MNRAYYKEPTIVRGYYLGYILTKERNYLGITFPEYALVVTGSHRCNEGIFNYLDKYKSSYKIKYSTHLLNKFYVGKIDYDLVSNKYISLIRFESHTHKNRWGWNFDSAPNEYYVEIPIGREDQLWLWKEGFAIAKYKECSNYEIDMLHVFMVINDIPYGIGPTNQPPYFYLGQNHP